MKDFVGNELRVGDKVVYACTRGSGTYMGVKEIIGFTEKMVKVKTDSYYHHREYDLIQSRNCVLYREPEVSDVKTEESR